MKSIKGKINKVKEYLNKIFILFLLEIFLLSQAPVRIYSEDKVINSINKNIPDNHKSIQIPKNNEAENLKISTVKSEIIKTEKSNEAFNINEEIEKEFEHITNVVDGNKGGALPDKDLSMHFNNVSIDLPKGSVKNETEITIEELKDVNGLNPGMYNVTGGVTGYRFLPHGMKFKKKVRIKLPYDKSKIQDELELVNLHTYFYNEEKKEWEKLEKIRIDRDKGEIVSLTDHFTDFINSTLKMPESPKPLSFNPNSIKDIKAANPMAGIPEIKGFEGGPFGSATCSLPLNIPEGRKGLTPKLSIDYNSSSGNGWLGVGFDINIPCISIDTKFGVPNYDGNDVLLLNGEEIVPVGKDSRTQDIIYQPRSEQNFDKIARIGSDIKSCYFEVISRDGTTSVYGKDNNAVLAGSPGIYKWFLSSITDTNGNTIVYNYSNILQDTDYYTYLSNISYTGNTNGALPKYRIDFKNLDGTLGDGISRKDKKVDCRGKFVTKLGSRLQEIRVIYIDNNGNDVLVRKYVLTYQLNEFFQSKLTDISEWNSDSTDPSAKFYSYKFDYIPMPKSSDGNYIGFQSEQDITIGSNDLPSPYSMETDHSLGGGGSTFVGLGLGYGYPAFNLSIGLNMGFNLDYRYSTCQFLDINGDGLPDFIYQPDINSPLNCQLNKIEDGKFDFSYASGLEGKTLNESFQAGFNIGGSMALLVISGSIGGSFNWSNSFSTFADMNGDGFIDFVSTKNPTQYLKGESDGDNGFHFNTIGFDSSIQQTTINLNPPANSDVNKINASFHLVDSVRKWKAYHKGTIEIKGDTTKLDNQQDTSDGVKINLYKNSNSLWNNINNDSSWSGAVDSSELSKSVLLNEGHATTYSHDDVTTVEKNDNIYFKVNSIKKIENDQVQWDPEISYKEIYFHDDMGDYFCGYDPSILSLLDFNNLVSSNPSYGALISSCYDSGTDVNGVQIYTQNSNASSNDILLKYLCANTGIIVPFKIERSYFESALNASNNNITSDDLNFIQTKYYLGVYTDYYCLDSAASNSDKDRIFNILETSGFLTNYLNQLKYYKYNYNNTLYLVNKQANNYFITINSNKLNSAADIIYNSLNSTNVCDNTEKGILVDIIQNDDGTITRKWIKISGANVLMTINTNGTETVLTANLTTALTSSWGNNISLGNFLTVTENDGNYNRSYILTEYSGLPYEIDKDLYLSIYENDMAKPISPTAYNGILAKLTAPTDTTFVKGCYTANKDINNIIISYSLNNISAADEVKLLNLYFTIGYYDTCYTLNAAGDYYVLSISGPDSKMIALLNNSNITAFNTLTKSISVSSNTKYEVARTSYIDGITEDKVRSNAYETNSNKDSTSYIELPDFDNTGKTSLNKVYIHVFKQSYDFSLADIITNHTSLVQSFSASDFQNNLNYLINKKSDQGYDDGKGTSGNVEINTQDFFKSMYAQSTDGSTYTLNTNLLGVPYLANGNTVTITDAYGTIRTLTNGDQLLSVLNTLGYGFEYFKGGVYSWFYGEWDGDYSWDESLIGKTNMPQNFSYFTGMASYSPGASTTPLSGNGPNDANNNPTTVDFTGYIPQTQITEDAWKGSEFEYKERSATGDINRDFCNYMTKNAYSPSRVGGNTIDKLPQQTTSVSLGGMNNMIQSSYSSSLNWGAGLASVSFSGSNMGKNICEHDFFDLNGDGCPDQIIFPMNGGRMDVLYNEKGKGFNKGATFTGMTHNLREVITNTLGFGFTFSTSLIDSWLKLCLSDNGETKSAGPNKSDPGNTVTGGFSSGMNGSVGTSKTTVDWVDINGDGLIDQVIRYGEGGISVKLNTGDGFKDTTWESKGWNNYSLYSSGEFNGLNNQDGYINNVIKHETTTSGSMNMSTEISALVVGGGVSMSLGVNTVRTEIELIDMNGDGLPDEVLSLKDDNGNPCLYVRFNLGDRFADDFVKWEYSDATWGMHNYFVTVAQTALSNMITKNGGSTPFGGISINNNDDKINNNPFLKDMNIFGVEDAIEYSATMNLSIGGDVSAAINLGPLPLTLSMGGTANFAYSRTSAVIKTIDMDGDGLPDRVFKSELENFVRVKLNNAKQVGLLRTITTPSGGTIDLRYEKTKNTVEMPHAQYTMNSVTYYSNMENNEDGSPKGYQYTYSYDNGYYDRSERTFFGFKTVTTTAPDGSKTVNDYDNTAYYKKGTLKQSETFDTNGNPYTLMVNDYSYQMLVDQPIAVETIADHFVDKSPYFVRLDDTIKTVYDINNASNSITTEMDYTYDSNGNIATALDKKDASNDNDDVFVKITYDPSTASKHILNNPSVLEVRTKNEIGTLLRKRTGQYNANGNLISLAQYFKDSVNNVDKTYTAATLTFDAYGNVKTVTDPNGYRIAYGYDGLTNSHVTSITDSNTDGTTGYTSTATYDPKTGLEKTTADINGKTMIKDYDGFGRLSNIWTSYDTGTTPALHFDYFQNDFPARAVTKNKVHFNPGNHDVLETVVIIDGMNRVIQTKKEGEVSEDISEGAVTDPNYGMNVSGKIEYDTMGRVLKQCQPAFQECSSGQPDEHLYAYTANDFSYLTETHYDTIGRVIETILPDTTSKIKNAYGITSIVDVDGFSRKRFMTTVTDPNNHDKTSFSDVNGNILRIDQNNVVNNNNVTISTTYTYDLMNEITSVIDTKGNTTSITYDSLGRRTSINNPDSGLMVYAYDDAGNIIKKEDPKSRSNGRSTTYSYDDFNRLRTINYPTKAATTFSYGGASTNSNSSGRISSITDESGTTSFDYGALGEQTAITKTMKRLITNYNPTMTFSSSYLYDYLGRMEQITYPDGEALHYVYDRGGQIKQVYGEHRNTTFDYVNKIYYDKFGQRVMMEYGNNTKTNYTYNPARRWLSEIYTTGKDSNNQDLLMQDIAYDFDAVGNINSIHNKNSIKETVQTFGYDNLYQLTSASGVYTDRAINALSKTNSYTQAYTYDNIGNMTKKTSFNDVPYGSTRYPESLNYSFDYTYDAGKPHRATKIGTMAYTYDANGNVTEVSDASEATTATPTSSPTATKPANLPANMGWSSKAIARYRNGGENNGSVIEKYFWDDENRMTEAQKGNSTTYFKYDYTGERTVKNGDFGETVYYDKFYQVQTTNNPMLITKHIFVGDTRIVSKISDTNDANVAFEQISQFYYHGDHLGSSNYVTDYQGQQYEHLEYTPYGETWVEESKDTLNQLNYNFTSKELDEETGLYYFGARYLDPQTSRWMSPDPIYDGVRDGMSIYGYCYNNPLIYHDPSGLETEKKNLFQNLFVQRKDPLGVSSLQKGSIEKIEKNFNFKDANGNDTGKGYGNTVWIRNNDGILSQYSHLDEDSIKDLKVGQNIEKGEQFAKMGHSGTDGTHLHLSLYGKDTKASDLTSALKAYNESRRFGENHPGFYQSYLSQSAWPTNTHTTGQFYEQYFNASGVPYPHEGWDFGNGNIQNQLITGWEYGIYNHTEWTKEEFYKSSLYIMQRKMID